MNIKIGRKEYNVTNNDLVFFNGACYICTTLVMWKDYFKTSPSMSKTQAQKLIKSGQLKLLKENLEYVTSEGKEMWYRWYRFNV